VLCVLLVLTGCATVKAVWAPVAPPSEAERAVRQADTFGRGGHPAAARDLYQQVVREHPADHAAAEALYRLGLLHADPTSTLHDYRAARASFTRLLAEYPRSRWDAEARAWQATLTDLLVREDEARRATQRLQRSEDDRKRAKTTQERLKQTDIYLEGRK
jgi:outer membrane protein assembly factor BamD (BamD/ComL family)